MKDESYTNPYFENSTFVSPRLNCGHNIINKPRRYGRGLRYRVSLKTRLIKEKTDRYESCKETFRRRAVALQGRLTKQMTCIAVFSQKRFLEMPYIIGCHSYLIFRGFGVMKADFFVPVSVGIISVISLAVFIFAITYTNP